MAWFDWDYVIRLIQQSQDKKGLLTHDHRSHRRGEEELLLRKTIVTIVFQEQKMKYNNKMLHKNPQAFRPEVGK